MCMVTILKEIRYASRAPWRMPLLSGANAAAGLWRTLRGLLLSIFVLAGARPASAQSADSGTLERMVEDVIALFDQADVIALGESHGSKLDSDFRIALVRHPDFGRVVDVIVVEFANAHRQDVLDRFISGEAVPSSELVRIWRDTGYAAWESPIYEAFLIAVRDANTALPPELKIRVIAGDMPIDWEVMTSGRELLQFTDRGDYPTHVVDCEILAPGRKGLLVYGSLHLLHGPGDSFVTSLDAKYPGRLRTLVGVLGPDEAVDQLRNTLGLGQDPRLILLPGTSVDDWDFYESRGFGQQRSSLPLGKAVDGLLYYGAAKNSVVSADSAVFEDPHYRAQRARQSQLRKEFGEIVDKEGWSGMRQFDDYTCRSPSQ